MQTLNSRRRAADAPLERAEGRLSLTVKRDRGRDAIADLAQSGCGRFLFPARAAGAPLEAVVVNTGGGLTGGDRFAVAVAVEAEASAVVATQACEKIYASSAGDARVAARLSLGSGARLAWLPQETILFESSRLRRSLAVEMAADAELLAVEAVLLGRQAMGEVIEHADLRDSWRIRRAGRLVFAEEAAAGGPHRDWAALRASPALLGGAAALATIVHVAPEAGKGLDDLRAIMEASGVAGGASAFDGLLTIRLAAADGLALRQAVTRLIGCFWGDPPRVWMT